MTEIDESTLLDGDEGAHDGPLDDSLLEEDNELKDVKDDADLYDDAIAPTNISTDAPKSAEPTSPTVQAAPATQPVYTAPSDGRKFCCYVGNLLWYTTDADLMKCLASTGMPRSQLADMKFFENRTNGQSKGYALLVLNSEAAVRIVMDEVPSKTIHGQNPSVLNYNKTNQAKLEDAHTKTQTRPDAKKKTDDSCVNMGTIRIGSNQGGNMRGNPPPLMMQNTMCPPQPMMNSAPMGSGQPVQMRLQINGQTIQPNMMNRGGQMNGQGGMSNVSMGGMVQPMGAQPNMMMGNVGQARPLMQTNQIGMQPPLVGMNGPPPGGMQFQNRPPQIGGTQQPMMGAPQPLMQMNTSIRPPANGMPPVHVNPQMFPGMQCGPVSDAEFEDIMNRNRTVASSAISRAVSDAAAGDLKGATETILTAIALIKQSRVGHDDRCRQLIYNLEDTLKGLESKGYSSRKSYRDRSRSRERDRKRRRRSRSRSYSRSSSPRRRRY